MSSLVSILLLFSWPPSLSDTHEVHFEQLSIFVNMTTPLRSSRSLRCYDRWKIFTVGPPLLKVLPFLYWIVILLLLSFYIRLPCIWTSDYDVGKGRNSPLKQLNNYFKGMNISNRFYRCSKVSELRDLHLRLVVTGVKEEFNSPPQWKDILLWKKNFGQVNISSSI